MIDIQNERDTRDIPLQKVGVKGLRYPVQVLDRVNGKQTTTATADLFVNLPRHYKGTHMSRFIETFHAYHGDLSMKRFLAMLEEIRTKLDARCAFGTLSFPFFMEKQAPVSGQTGMMCYECTYEGEVRCVKGTTTNVAKADGAPINTDTTPTNTDDEPSTEKVERVFTVSVAVPVTTLCPCSKAISDYGAHNQRGVVRVKVRNTGFFWIEDIIDMVEHCASSGVYSLLKREDEKYVTEHAYDNPRFVEDVVREVYTGLKNFASGAEAKAEKPFTYFSVEAETYESIHYHNAYAYTEYDSENQ